LCKLIEARLAVSTEILIALFWRGWTRRRLN
jgi:hypothetical protein